MAAPRFGRHKPHVPPFGNGVDQVRVVQQAGLQLARRLPVRRVRQISRLRGHGTHVGRLSLRQHFAPMQDDDMLATFGLVEVGRARAEPSAPDREQVARMMSHNSRRDSGSTPTVGSSSRSNSGERTSVQASPSFCFIPPESWPASRFVNGPSAVIAISRAIAFRALLAR